jgi:hypothetical protein
MRTGSWALVNVVLLAGGVASAAPRSPASKPAKAPNLQLPASFQVESAPPPPRSELRCSAVLDSLGAPAPSEERADELQLSVLGKRLVLRCSRALTAEEKRAITERVLLATAALQIAGPLAAAVLLPLVERALGGLATLARLPEGVAATGAAAIGQRYSNSPSWAHPSQRNK